jgi:hypothetical protein
MSVGGAFLFRQLVPARRPGRRGPLKNRPLVLLFGIVGAARAADQLASRQVAAGSSPSSAPSCNRTGSRSPSIARRNTPRANSSGFTVVLPIDLSVSQASSKAVSKSMSVGGSKELLWNPRMARPQSFHTDTDIFG